jgi:hypothetical protein
VLLLPVDSRNTRWFSKFLLVIQGDKDVSVQVMTTVQKVSSLQTIIDTPNCVLENRQGQGNTRLTPTPSVITNSNYNTMARDWNCLKHEVESKIFRTGAAIYTAVVVARSTGPNRPNCESQVLLRSFAATGKNVRRRHPELWRKQTRLFHHDNVPSHTSCLTQQFLVKYKMTLVPHPP